MNHMDFELYSAVIFDNNELLKQIESRLSVVDQRTPTNFTVLHLASQYGSLKCVEEILSTHSSLLLKVNVRGETSLHLAAREGHYDVAKALIDAAKSSLVPLNHLPNKSSSVVEFLIRTVNLEFETAMHKAVRYNHLKVVELLVTEDPSNIHPPNKNDETPLYLASLRGYKDIVSTILDKCVSPTFGGPDGRTALHAAVLDNGQTECLKLLLDKKKELIKVADSYGWTVFHYVAYENRHDIVDDLVNVDKSVAYLADKLYKKIPLHIAAYKGHIKVMKKLLKYCPDSSDIVDGSGRNILHIAVEKLRKHMIKYILTECKEIKTLLSQKDKEGNTPLHLMAKLGCYVSEVMHHKQVDWEVLNDENLTPLDVLHSTKEPRTDQWKIRTKLIQANVKTHWYLGRTVREPDTENGEAVALYVNKHRLEVAQKFRKMISTHMIVVALIATVALTAGFAMPGGFDGNAGPNQGSPSLLKKTAFRVFVLTDTIAVLCSISSLFIYFMTTLYRGAHSVQLVAMVAAGLNVLSIIALMLAFITGMYAVLLHSSDLAISVCVISSLFFLLLYWFLILRPLLLFISRRRLYRKLSN